MSFLISEVLLGREYTNAQSKFLVRDRIGGDAHQGIGQTFLSENEDGGVTGHTIVRIEHDDSGKQFGLFSTTFVAPEFRRQAIADSLLRRGETWMVEHGVNEAVTYTSDANTKLINLYEINGYKIVEVLPGKKMIKLAKPLLRVGAP